MLTTPDGVDIECVSAGRGEPVTVFAHGMGSGIPDTRPLGSGVAGTKIFFQFRGHGRSGAPPGPWTYADLAADLTAVADDAGATRAVGASLGAAALCRLVAARPDRFARMVFYLPAVLDQPRPAAARQRLADLLAGGPALAAAVAAEAPGDGVYQRLRLAQLSRYPLAPQLATLVDDVPVPDPGVLAPVRAPALVIGCHGDPLHPAPVAERLARALGNATLHLYDEPYILRTARADLRARISGFLK